MVDKQRVEKCKEIIAELAKHPEILAEDTNAVLVERLLGILPLGALTDLVLRRPRWLEKVEPRAAPAPETAPPPAKRRGRKPKTPDTIPAPATAPTPKTDGDLF